MNYLEFHLVQISKGTINIQYFLSFFTKPSGVSMPHGFCFICMALQCCPLQNLASLYSQNFLLYLIFFSVRFQHLSLSTARHMNRGTRSAFMEKVMWKMHFDKQMELNQ